MNPPASSPSEQVDPALLTRREAIQRAALILGAAISPSILTGLMSAQVAQGTANLRPKYLDAKQLATASALAERIIPRTDTPGALDVGVPAFIDLMVGEYLTAEEKRVFLAGLAEVDARSAAAHRKNYAALSPAEQDALLKAFADESKNKEKTFFYQLKELTLTGFFTAEPIGRTVLHYDPIPGRFDPCVPLSAVGNKAWTR
ncbi:MAG TPA: gluconate 2-dehydrogenase subunit 3 family protein [Opitutaceae bacterium]|nr:gluconate 2-dehydrogenase subunit 3 family protein [Opitutaceae bacterium]